MSILMLIYFKKYFDISLLMKDKELVPVTYLMPKFQRQWSYLARQQSVNDYKKKQRLNTETNKLLIFLTSKY
jgi:hypothetical protein